MQNHNLSPEEFEYEQQVAAYYEVEGMQAREVNDMQRMEICRQKRLDALRVLGMIGLEESQ